MQAIWTISQVILPIVRFGKLPLILTLLADDCGSAREQDQEASEAGDHKDRILGGIPVGAVSHRGGCKNPLPPLRDWIRLKTLRKGIQNPLPCKHPGVERQLYVNRIRQQSLSRIGPQPTLQALCESRTRFRRTSQLLCRYPDALWLDRQGHNARPAPCLHDRTDSAASPPDCRIIRKLAQCKSGSFASACGSRAAQYLRPGSDCLVATPHGSR